MSVSIKQLLNLWVTMKGGHSHTSYVIKNVLNFQNDIHRATWGWTPKACRETYVLNYSLTSYPAETDSLHTHNINVTQPASQTKTYKASCLLIYYLFVWFKIDIDKKLTRFKLKDKQAISQTCLTATHVSFRLQINIHLFGYSAVVCLQRTNTKPGPVTNT